MSLNHLEFPEAPVTSTYKRTVRDGSIVSNNGFPFTRKEWLEHREQRPVTDPAGKDYSAGYLAKLDKLRTAYIPPTNS